MTAQANLGAAWQALGDLEQAETCYRQALDIDPRHPQAIVGVGAIQHIRNDLTAALQSFEQRWKSIHNYPRRSSIGP